MWLRFVAEYCPKVPYILKIDDDIAFNYFRFMVYLRLQNVIGFHSKSFICYVWKNVGVAREGKWYFCIFSFKEKKMLDLKLSQTN